MVLYKFKRVFLLGCTLLCLARANAQKDSLLLDKWMKEPLWVLPTAEYAPETSWAFGFMGIYRFKPSKVDSSGGISTIRFNFAYSLRNQIVFALPFQVFSKGRKSVLQGEVSYNIFPYRFWGTGNNINLKNFEMYEPKYFVFRGNYQKKIKGSFYAGISWLHENYVSVKTQPGGVLASGIIRGEEGGMVSGGGPGIMFDNRDLVMNPSKGAFLKTYAMAFKKGFGSDFNYSVFTLDARKFFNLKKNKYGLLAIQNITQLSNGEVPFFQMAMAGGEQMLRGYYRGAYREHNYTAFQAEYRKHIYKNWGVVAFASTGWINRQARKFWFPDNLFSGGCGIRYKFDKVNNLNLRMDVAWGRSARAIYFGLGEAF